MSPSIFIALLLASTVVFGAAIPCQDIVRVWDGENEDVTPKILYFEGKEKKAEIYCEGEANGVVELFSNMGSLGVIENEKHDAVCKFGRWYSLDKYGKLAVVKQVACVVHI
ncbi:unnamed protein product [Caenorhabditis sp. 36 PRJEB53466]|nr:unnamed protein product [Caenorhabditis sp. 36 PRJEB53466]